MNRNDISRIRELPIESVAKRLGLTVNRHKALCPFHEDQHPSLSFKVSANTYKCFVCDAHGGVIDLAMKMLGKGFLETCQWLADEHNVIMTRYPPAVKEIRHYPPDVDYLSGLMRYPVLNESARHFLFDQRRLNPRVIEWCGISSISYPTPCWRYGRPFYDAPSLLMPYKDIDGRILNVQSRYLGVENGVPRFRFPANSSIHIFNLPVLRLLKPNEPLFISEGITDCLALLSAGHKAIAIPSATSLKPSDMKNIEDIIRVGWKGTLHMFPDDDEPGEYLFRKVAGIANELGVCLMRHSLPQGCKDFSDYYLSTYPRPV